MAKTRVLIIIEGGAIQTIATDGGDTEFFIFDQDNLEGGETDKEAYKENFWGVETMNKNLFDKALLASTEKWEKGVQENIDSKNESD